MSRWTLPWYSSSATGGRARTMSVQRPLSQVVIAALVAVHSHRKSHHGRSWKGAKRNAIGGV